MELESRRQQLTRIVPSIRPMMSSVDDPGGSDRVDATADVSFLYNPKNSPCFGNTRNPFA